MGSSSKPMEILARRQVIGRVTHHNLLAPEQQKESSSNEKEDKPDAENS
jgi:hypothetical protein